MKKNLKRILCVFLSVIIFISSTGIIATTAASEENMSQSYSANSEEKDVITIIFEFFVQLIQKLKNWFKGLFIKDKDFDGVSDDTEKALGINERSKDTDGDGLNDYIEIYTVGSDPAVFDSNEDSDGDKISNIDEINKYKTSPLKEDTDLDGLSDFNEINKYHTIPTNADTDKDNIPDGKEIELGTDPLASTDLTKITQHFNIEASAPSLMEGNDIVPQISGCSGSVLSDVITVSESKIGAIGDNRAILSKGINLEIEPDVEIELAFDVPDVTEDNFVILRGTEAGDWSFQETTDNDGSVKTTVTEDGIYCVADLNALLSHLGIDMSSYYNDITDAEPIEEFYTAEFTTETLVGNSANSATNETSADCVLDDRANSLVGTANITKSTLEKAASISPMGQADIVFAIDTTGSMSEEISNVANNVIMFANTLSTTYNVNANYALVEYGDITYDGIDSTKIIKNGSSNWYTNVEDYKTVVGALSTGDGGDSPETAVDALEASRTIDWRASAQKFIILVTDSTYKVNNNYGITSMTEEISLLKENNIVVSVVTSSEFQSIYHSLYDTTGGIYADIYGNFSSALLSLADIIGANVSEKHWVLLSDFQYVALDKPVSKDSGDTDRDSISDYTELGPKQQVMLTPLVKKGLQAQGVPASLINDYFTDNDVYLSYYAYSSNPAAPDTDFDGIEDLIDLYPRNNHYDGSMHGSNNDIKASYTLDYRDFFRPNTVYNDSLATTSLVFSTLVYANGSYSYDVTHSHANNNGSVISLAYSKDIKQFLNIHMEDIQDYKLKNYYKDDDISEIALGHKEITYNGATKSIIAVVVRGTNRTIEEWSSNFDLGDRSKTFDGWKTKENHKGFDVTSNRVLAKVNEYIKDLQKANKLSDDIVYWVTGHSRGAAIANIVSAYLVDAGAKVYAYTFAAPNTTIKNTVKDARYRCIFNIINEDDFVPCVPMTGWGFKRYGVTASIDVTSDMENELQRDDEKQIKYNALPLATLEDLISSMCDVSPNKWEGCYTYTCSCHGDETCDDIIESGIDDINKIPYRIKKYCEFEEYTTWYGMKQYKVCQLPVYFMQVLAQVMSEKDNFDKGMDLFYYQMAERYQKVRNKIVWNSFGIISPHYCEVYYHIIKHTSASNFS